MDDYDFYRDGNRQRRGHGLFSYFMVGLIGAVIGALFVLTFAPAALLGKVVLNNAEKVQEAAPPKEAAVAPAKVDAPAAGITEVVKRTIPTVVGIRTTKFSTGMFFGKTKMEGVGSGIIIDTKGYILTNNHVADSSASDITVYIEDGRTVPGKVVWSDESLDLSILKVNADKLTAAAMGNSDIVEAGESVIAIGNPLGMRFERSVTAGIISALNRSVPVGQDVFMEGLIQTDASINEGNSGGPLIDSQGNVIGINTIKVKSAEGMGFAIPINIVIPVIKNISDSGSFITPYMGVTGLDREIASLYDYRIDKGIYIEKIDKMGPAYKAGIRKGDTLLEINGTPVDTLTAFRQVTFNAGAGGSVKIKYATKDGTVNSTDAVLGQAH